MASFTGGSAGDQFTQSLTKLLTDFYTNLGGHWECMRVYRG
jgi:hypothetical protein